MDRAGAVTWPEHARERRNPLDEFVLPSRAEAIHRLENAMRSQAGPILLTGGPGVGKSWVCARLPEALPDLWRWVVIDLSPAINESGLHRLILHALGSDPVEDPADARTTLAEILSDSAEDGIGWGLIVEDAQNASAGVMEELRILGNRMGEPGALGGLILVGQNELARRLTTRSLASFQARISTRVHLRPLDVNELRAWINRLDPGAGWSDLTVERLHREIGGNPRKALSLVLRPVALTEPRPEPKPKPVSTSAPIEAIAAKPRRVVDEKPQSWDAPPVAPGKPPLQIGEGMIEVGWEPTAESQTEVSSEFGNEPERSLATEVTSPSVVRQPVASTTGPTASEQVVDDHYAALQAWTEWAQNQGREPVGAMATQALSGLPGDAETTLDPDENPAARLSGHSGVWAEGQQEFAPYSQLFSRLRQSRDRP